MKTLKREQIKTIKLFLNDVVSYIDEDACPCLNEVSYDFRKNRYKLTANFYIMVISKNEFEPEIPHKLIGEFEFSCQASYDDTMVQTNVKPLVFVWASSPSEVVTDKNIIRSIVLPFKDSKGGVVPCVVGEEGAAEVEGVEAVESMSGCLEAESECNDFPCNDSPFSNASLE